MKTMLFFVVLFFSHIATAGAIEDAIDKLNATRDLKATDGSYCASIPRGAKTSVKGQSSFYLVGGKVHSLNRPGANKLNSNTALFTELFTVDANVYLRQSILSVEGNSLHFQITSYAINERNPSIIKPLMKCEYKFQ